MENKKQLKCTWSSEISEFMKNKYGIDINEIMMESLGKDIIKELDNQIIREKCTNIIKKKYPNFQV